MFDDDLAYFSQRAGEEREKAATASHPSIADIHLALAAKYEDLVEQTRTRRLVDGGLGSAPTA